MSTVAQAVLGAGVLAAAMSAPAAALPVPEQRPDIAQFDLVTLDGQRLKSTDLLGKVVVISFWATWCSPCKQELDNLAQIVRSLNVDDLVILAVATDGTETRAEVRSIVRRKAWPVAAAADETGRVTAVLNPRGAVPYSLFVDRRGRVARIHSGFKTGDEALCRETIGGLLAESTAR